MANIGTHNVQTVYSLYKQPFKMIGHPPRAHTAHQRHHLPEDICASIKSGAKNQGAGVNADLIDVFINLISLNVAEANSDV